MEPQECTWYQYTLRPYESLSSIGAKFCFWNRVKVKDFAEFIGEFFPDEAHAGEGGNSNSRPIVETGRSKLVRWMNHSRRLSPFDVNQFNGRKLARTLGESYQKVQYSAFSRFLPDLYDNDRLDISSVVSFACLRYCPQCIARGYHAIFHQLPWLEKCLIHEDLLLAGQKKQRSSEDPFPFGDGSLTQDVYDLIFGGAAHGEYRCYDDFRSDLRTRSADEFTHWLHWGSRLCRDSGVSHFQDFRVYSGEEHLASSELFQFAAMLSEARRFAKKFYTCGLTGRVTSKQFQLDDSQVAAVEAFLRGIPRFGLRNLVDLRRRTAHLCERTSWETLAEQCVLEILRADSALSVEPLIAQSTGGSHTSLLTEDDCSVPQICANLMKASWLHRHQGGNLNLISLTDEVMFKTGMVESFTVTPNSERNPGLPEGAQITCWKPAWPFNEICDALLDCEVLAAAWHLFEIKKSPRPILVSAESRTRNPFLYLKLHNDRVLEMAIGWRTPAELPRWEQVDVATSAKS